MNLQHDTRTDCRKGLTASAKVIPHDPRRRNLFLVRPWALRRAYTPAASRTLEQCLEPSQ